MVTVRMNRKKYITTLNISAGDSAYAPIPVCPTGERLAESFSHLQTIQLVRNHRQDPDFAKCIEERIIWRELLDLELHEVDEQIARIAAAAGQD
jgi:hypothetical protein